MGDWRGRLAAFAAAVLAPSLVLPAAARAHEGAAEWLELPFMAGFEAAGGRPPRDLASAQLAYLVRRAGAVADSKGRTLLPAGTMLDDCRFEAAGEVTLALTLGATGEFFVLDEDSAAALDTLVRGLMEATCPPAGLNIHLRRRGGDYLPLKDYLPSDMPPARPDPPEGGEVGGPVAPGGEAQALGGPIANADGQPAGALSGVVVFCTAGHGWTAGSSSWSLQRPLLHSLNEDYGNLDQLNYFVAYLQNAGATVVPFRPVGYQTSERVLDNDDPGVTYTGAWNNSTTTQHFFENGVTASGVPYRWAAASASETAAVRYTPNLPKADFYPVYCWTKHDTDRVPQTYRIRHSGGTASATIDHARAGKGWIWLGNYHFEAGTGGWVEITNRSTRSGVVIADAIRFGNGMGSLARPGPGRVSGYPREEECMRYWAHSELGINAVGFDDNIWDSSSSDSNDNVSAGARWGREMNRTDINNERWRRIYIEFHSNATDGVARGSLALYNTGSGGTTNQLALATLLGNKLEADLLAADDAFEYSWAARNPNTYHASFDYGAINAAYNGNEFDATILEVAFHDQPQDAALMRDAKVRDAIARSTAQGLVQFLSDGALFPGTQVPRVFLPDPPERAQAAHDGNGNVVVSWSPGPARPQYPASGDPPTGYRIYRSLNGYGFGNAVSVGGQTSVLLADLPADTTVYLRVAAINAGGESMPSATLAVRRPAQGAPGALIVDGYDRVGREQNVIQQIPAGGMERPIPRRVNSFDYSVQHARALAAAGHHFDCATNEALIHGGVDLSKYRVVVWILGRESWGQKTFDSTEQSLLAAYLGGGGRLFATGSEIAYELDGLGAGRAFCENVLHANYVADDAGTYNAAGTGFLAEVGPVSFDPAGGAAYDVPTPDVLAPLAGAVPVLTYSGGIGGSAGIAYDSPRTRVVLFGFPFEAISSEPVRHAVMRRVIEFLDRPWSSPADFDLDGDVDLSDFGHLQACFTGPGLPATDPACHDTKLDADQDVDSLDLTLFRTCLTGEAIPADPNCPTP